MNEELMAAFDECLNALVEGDSLEDCLKRYPDLAEELAPRLQTALRMQTLTNSIKPLPGTQKASRAQFLMQTAMLASQKQSHQILTNHNGHRPGVTTPAKRKMSLKDTLSWLLHPQMSRAMAATVILVVILLAGAGVWSVSAQSLPGTPLYGLKRAVENAQLALSPNAESRARLEEKFSDQHILEARQVTELGWSVPLEFGGILESIVGENWSVGGIALWVPSGVTIEGNPQVGLYVRVWGSAQTGGTVQASRIKVDGVLFQGKVDDIRSKVWRIDGREVFTSQDTQIEGTPEPGDTVEINAMQMSDGNLLAEKIRLIDRKDASPDVNPNDTVPDKRENDVDSTPLPGSNDTSVKTAESTHPSGGDGSSDKTPELTHSPSGKGGNDSSNKGTQEPTHTPSSQGGGNGITPEPTRTEAPTQTPQATQTPHSGGGTSPDPTKIPTPQEVRFQGPVQSIGGSTWTVAGQVVQVSSATNIDANLNIGDNVEVRANLQPDGSLLATRIQKK